MDTITISDGTTTISLNTSTIPGIRTEEFSPPQTRRLGTRVSGAPYANGGRIIASAFDNTSAEWNGYIHDVSIDAMEDQLHQLVRLLEQAQRWEKRKVGMPVRLAYKRDGATNTAYWTITGVDLPQPASSGKQMAIEGNTILRIRLRLTLEPLPHATALATTMAAETLWNNPSNNVNVFNGVTGELPAPMQIDLQASSGAAWTGQPSVVWFARLADVSQVADFSTESDGDYYSGGYDELSLSATESVFPYITLNMPQQYPLRIIARAKSEIGTAAQLMFRAKLLGEGYEVLAQTPWSPFEGPNGATALVDIGTLSVGAFQGESVGTSWPALHIGIYVKTQDNSAGVVHLDYVEILPYKAFVKVSSDGEGLFDNWHLVYEDVAAFGSYIMPRRAPMAYSVTLSDFRSTAWQIRGSFGRIEPVAINVDHIWCAVQRNLAATNRHVMNDEFIVTVKHLPMYSIGLRGNG